MKDHELAHACPWCGVAHDAAMGVTDDGAPAPGSAMFCSRCGRFGILTATGVRRPTELELDELAANDDAMRTVRAWLELEERR